MKKWADIILIMAFLFSLGAIIAYFMTEGFQNRLTMAEAGSRMGPSQVSVCMAQTSCSTCLDDDAHPGYRCGWCTAAQACIPRSGMYRLIPEWLMNIINLDPTKDCPPNSSNTQNNFVYTKGACTDATCTDYTNCRDCAGALACGWSISEEKCYNKISYANLGSDGSGSLSGSPSSRPTLTTQSGSCPPPTCSSITDCGQCTTTTGCGFCKDTLKCVQINANGSPLGGSSGSTGCAQGSIYTQIYQCPCTTLSKCTDCAQRPGCGYCTSSSKCINTLDSNGRQLDNDNILCERDKIATSSTQCVPGARLGNVRSESSDYKPGYDELNLAQDNTALGGQELNIQGAYGGPRGAGSGAVSPPTTSKYVSGNGAVRPFGAYEPRVTDYGDLTTSPLEMYVKTLVRSELASEGIPMNEPFLDVTSMLGSLFKY